MDIRWCGGLVLTVLACLCWSASAVAAGHPSVRDETARAQQVLAEVQRINIDLGRAAEAWDGARYRLSVLEGQEQRTRKQLGVARKSARLADRRLAQLLRAQYETGQPTSTDVLVGAASLDDVITRLDDAERLTDQQASVVRQVRTARASLHRQAVALARDVVSARRTAQRLAAERSRISQKLQQRQRLLASIRSEIATLKAQQRARERELAREARIRLMQQIVAAHRLAQQAAVRRAERARAAALAQVQQRLAARRRAPKPAPAPPPAPAAVPPTTAPAPPPTTTVPSQPSAPPPAPSPPPPSPPSATGGNTQVVSIAMQYLGVPYRWGGASPQTGFDCSGLVMYVFAQIGISLPHFAAAQYGYGTPVARDQLQPGDLVFFDHLSHVGIYIGNGQFIHAPHTGDVVRISDLGESWFSTNYVGARRIT